MKLCFLRERKGQRGWRRNPLTGSNGEQVAGFKDRDTGKFHEAAFIRNEKELKEFMEIYGIEKITKEY